MKRSEELRKVTAEKNAQKKKEYRKRKKERDALGDKAPKAHVRSIDKMREYDETVIGADDTEVAEDDNLDEFSEYFAGVTTPNIVITTNVSHNFSQSRRFIKELSSVIPNLHYFRRRTYSYAQIIEFCKNRGYTDVIVVTENHEKITGLYVSHLPNGPTAHFKVSNVLFRHQIRGRGVTTKHKPELILNHFDTRLGHTIGRMFASLFPQRPDFVGRRVVTFHNQRDYIFFRHHRYIFADPTKARLQELGPRFTLKLRSLQHGTFQGDDGQFEFYYRAKMYQSRKKFFL